VALLAFAADRRAAVDMDRKAAAPAVQQSIDIACPPGPQQQTRRTPWPRRKIGQTDALCRILCEQSHTRARMTNKFCVQLPTYADNVVLPAFAAVRRAAARLLLTAGPPAVQQSIDISWPPGPQQQTSSSGMRRPDETDGQTHRRTDGRPTVA